jgi:hypothetical protein
MKTTSIILSCLAIILMTSCVWKNYFEREIVGTWTVVDWQKEGVSNPVGNAGMWFEFSADSTYSSVFAGVREAGSYYIDGYKLYTTAEGEATIMTKIESLKSDTLKIGMNRGGREEMVILVLNHNDGAQ